VLVAELRAFICGTPEFSELNGLNLQHESWETSPGLVQTPTAEYGLLPMLPPLNQHFPSTNKSP